MGLFKSSSGTTRKTKNTTSTVNPYYQASSAPRTQARSPFVAKPPTPKPSNWRARVTNSVLLAVILVAVIWSLIVKLPPKVAVNSSIYHSQLVYKDFVNSQADKISNHTKLSFNQNGLVSAIKQQFPELSTVNLSLPIISQTPSLKLKVSKPTFFMTDSTGTYVIDDQGVVVGKSLSLPSIMGLINITDQSGFKLQPGKAAMSTTTITFINGLLLQCQSAKVPVASITLPNIGPELDLITKDQPYYVKFYSTGDLATQAGQFLATRHQLIQTHVTPSQYLDVRVSGKVYYK